jgi:RimJ/RimL family protein N-acetyltransferase
MLQEAPTIRIDDRPPSRCAPPDRVTLRPVQRSDLPVLFEQQLDPESNRMAVSNPRSRAAFYAFWEGALGDEAVVARVIVVAGEIVGSISVFPSGAQDHVGYWIGRRHWGRGFATLALQRLLAEVPRRPLHACVARSNIASTRVLQRCGFVIIAYRMSVATERFPACEEAILVLNAPS